MFEFIFWDLDNTLLDFHACEREALRAALSESGVEMTARQLARYSAINDSKWKLFEQGKISRSAVQLSRFEDFFAEFHLDLSPAAFNERYMYQMGLQAVEFPGIHAILSRLHTRYRQFIASNGVEKSMRSRLQIAGLEPYFEQSFSSEHIGVQKPQKAFFDACFAQISGFNPARAIIIGDSLSSDILGGHNAGIATCWFNPGGKLCTGSIVPDYELQTLSDVFSILPVDSSHTPKSAS